MTNPMRQRTIIGLKEGDLFEFSRTFSHEETEQFGELTRDYNPVHYDLRWAESKGFKGLICHGLLIGSMICEVGGQAGWLATGMNFKYVRPVYMGETITCSFRILKIEDTGRAEAEAIFVNERKEQVCYAYLTGRVPTGPELDLLQYMVDEGDPTNKLS